MPLLIQLRLGEEQTILDLLQFALHLCVALHQFGTLVVVSRCLLRWFVLRSGRWRHLAANQRELTEQLGVTPRQVRLQECCVDEGLGAVRTLKHDYTQAVNITHKQDG